MILTQSTYRKYNYFLLLLITNDFSSGISFTVPVLVLLRDSERIIKVSSTVSGWFRSVEWTKSVHTADDTVDNRHTTERAVSVFMLDKVSFTSEFIARMLGPILVHTLIAFIDRKTPPHSSAVMGEFRYQRMRLKREHAWLGSRWLATLSNRSQPKLKFIPEVST